MNLLLTGNWNRKEFQEVAAFFSDLKGRDTVDVRYISSIDDFTANERDGNFEPELCVLFADYPGRFGDSFWRRIRSRFPLTRFLLLSGALCQGEERTGSLEQGIVRAPWYLWRDFIKEEVLKFLTGKLSVLSLEETALFEDQVRETASYDALTGLVDEEGKIRRIRIASDDFAMRNLLRDMIVRSDSETVSRTVDCGTLNDLFQSEKRDAKENCDYFIIDLPDSACLLLRCKIQKLAKDNPNSGIDLLLSGPNPEEVEDFEKISGCRIVPKPFFSKIFDSRSVKYRREDR